MPVSEEPSSGPVIHDHRRIDPVTGQVRGKHVASKPAGTRGAGRPGPGALGDEAADSAETSGSARSAGSQEDQDTQETQKYPEEVPEVVTQQAPGGRAQAPTPSQGRDWAEDGKRAAEGPGRLRDRAGSHTRRS